jgi:hypothetical protein
LEQPGPASEFIIEGLIPGAAFVIFFKSFAARNQFLPGKHGISFIEPVPGVLEGVLDAPPERD